MCSGCFRIDTLVNRLASTAYFARPRYAASQPRSLLYTVKYKIDNNSKTKNRTKKTSEYNNSYQVNYNLPWKFGHFGQNVKRVDILGAQNDPYGRPLRPNTIWCDMKFAPIISLRILYAKMGTFEGEGWVVVCRSVIGTWLN